MWPEPHILVILGPHLTKSNRFKHLRFAAPLQVAFPGVDFSASGLQAVALVFERQTRNLEISNLLNAPLLESVELECESGSELELSAEINVQRHDKPFRFTIVSTRWLAAGPPLRLLAWQPLEDGFGPQNYNPSLYKGFLLHGTLLQCAEDIHLQIYCNSAHTRAGEAEWRRRALAPCTCDHRLFASRNICENCEEDLVPERSAWY